MLKNEDEYDFTSNVEESKMKKIYNNSKNEIKNNDAEEEKKEEKLLTTITLDHYRIPNGELPEPSGESSSTAGTSNHPSDTPIHQLPKPTNPGNRRGPIENPEDSGNDSEDTAKPHLDTKDFSKKLKLHFHQYSKS